jgi:PHD/YefM family antitoxin component YafN of YafNO toxin-antitoxin module
MLGEGYTGWGGFSSMGRKAIDKIAKNGQISIVGEKMFEVQVKQISEIQSDFSDAEKILNNHDRILLTNNGKDAAVLINIDDYTEFESYAQKEYINRKLSEAKIAAGGKNTVWLDEEDFWDGD